MPVKYFSDVPSMSNIASSEFSLINFLARSWRSLRSSHVMGEASPLRDFNRAREGGREESSFLWARGEANRGFSAREVPAVTPPTSRKRRREIISAPGREIGSGYYRDRKSTRLNSSHSQISYAVFCLTTTQDKRHNYKRPEASDLFIRPAVHAYPTRSHDANVIRCQCVLCIDRHAVPSSHHGLVGPLH